MDVVERLPLEVARSELLIAREHRHRYDFAAQLCPDARMLDLCCGSGYGCEILAQSAAAVVGVDNDAATIDTARSTVGRQAAGLSFELADAIAYLRREIADRFDVIVCFEGLEHLHELDQALALLRSHAERGVKLIVSVPNGKLFEERNPFHVTDFGYDDALQAFASFPNVVMVPQFLAEGSLICPPGAEQTEIELSLEDRDEPEYANHFIFCVNFDPEHVAGANRGRLHLEAAPLFNRWLEELKHGAHALARENARLARQRFGQASAGAASRVAALPAEVGALNEELAAWRERARVAEARAALLEQELARSATVGLSANARDWTTLPGGRRAAIAPGPPPADAAREPPPPAEPLVAWIERTVPLRDRTVLAYRCADGAVARACAERGAHVIAVDGDASEPSDMFLIDGVLDQLPIPERLELLGCAREAVRQDGVIVVCGVRNRLLDSDRLAARGAEALDRRGEGASFHEFEATFGELNRHVLASGYDPVLFGLRPVGPEELILARRLERRRPDLPPAFSRARLDLIISPRPLARRPAWIKPWPFETVGARGAGYTRADTVRLPAPGATLPVSLPHPTTHLVAGAIAPPGDLVLLARPATGLTPLRAACAPVGDWRPGEPRYTTFALPEPAQQIELSAEHPCELVFIGYED